MLNHSWSVVLVREIINIFKWRILAQTASVYQIIYDQFGGWFRPMSRCRNNNTPIINTPDLQELLVLKFYSIHDHTLWSFLPTFWSFLDVSGNFSSVIVRYDICTNLFSPIGAETRCRPEKLIISTDSTYKNTSAICLKLYN